MDFMSDVDDLYFLPPASVRDLTVNYEVVKLNIWQNEEFTFPKDKTGKTPVSNVKIEPGTKVQDCSLLEKESNLNSTRSDQLSQTTLVEKDMPLLSELLCDNSQEENDVIFISDTSACNNINSKTADTNAECMVEHLTSEISDTSEESNRTIKKKKTISVDEISKEKVMNENMSNSINKLHERKIDSDNDPLESLADLTDMIHNSSEIPAKITNSGIKYINFNNNLSKNLEKKNEIDNEVVQKSVPPPSESSTNPFDDNINKDINNIAKETTFCYIQNKITDSSFQLFESKKADAMTVNSSKNQNVPKNRKRNLDTNSVVDNSTNKSPKMSNICDDKSNEDKTKVDKDFIYQCLKNWRKNYPWASVEEDSWTLSCSLCSHYTEKNHIYQIKESNDIYQVAKHLRNHNVLPKHKFLNYFGYFDIFQKVFETLRDISKTFPSQYVLYENIKCIVKGYNGCLIDELDIDFLIKTVALVVREVVNNTIRSRICCGIGFICDPRRNILILKYTDCQNYPQESVITNYVNSDPPLIVIKKELFMSNVVNVNLTSGTLFSSSLYSKFNSSNVCKENTLPPLLPNESEFLDLMRKTSTILAFENFVWCLSSIYNKNSQYFQSLSGHAILMRPMWGLSELNSFIFENYLQLNMIINTSFQFSTDPAVCFCKSFVLDPNPCFFALTNAICCITNYLGRRERGENIRRDVSVKMEKFLKIIKEDKNFFSTYEWAIYVLSTYCREILNENYYNGIENIPDISFLLEPGRMTNLLAHSYQAGYDRANFRKIWLLLHKFIPLPVKTFTSMYLIHFGKHLLKISTKNKYNVNDIIGLFNHSPELRRNYPYILQFYIALGTLPFIKRNSRGSLPFISILRRFLQGNFNSDISNSILTILTEGPTLTECDFKTIYHMFLNRILEL